MAIFKGWNKKYEFLSDWKNEMIRWINWNCQFAVRSTKDNGKIQEDSGDGEKMEVLGRGAFGGVLMEYNSVFLRILAENLSGERLFFRQPS